MSGCKECPDCKRVLGLDSFSKNKASKDGKCRYCRQCVVKRSTASVNKQKIIFINIKEKSCLQCKQVKSLEQFNKNCRNPTGHGVYCRDCLRKYYETNKNRYLDRYQQKRDALLEYQKEWNKGNKHRKREYYRRYRSMLEKVLYGNAYGRFRGVLSAKEIVTPIPFSELLGCTDVELFFRFEAMFKEGMHEGNYGTEWEIDHIRPICSFDLTREEDLRKCFHYSNLQPLWKEENWMKGTSYTPE